MKNKISIILAFSFTALLISCNDEEACVETAWFQDMDQDGLGNADSTVMACEMPEGYVDNGNDDNDALASGEGVVTIMFDNVVGEEEAILVPFESVDNFPFTNSVNQSFNIDILGYYITEIKLIGMGNTEDYVDAVTISADGTSGVYHVLEEESSSQMIQLTNVPDGMYSSVEFTIGIPGNLVEEGATGGVLDPSNGAWFWNWNVGYVAFKIEGNSTAVGADDSDHFAFHVGGWGDTNNIKTIALDLPHHLTVADETMSMAHIKMDVLKAISGSTDIDFNTTYSAHSPSKGAPIAENLVNAFEVHHVQNN